MRHALARPARRSLLTGTAAAVLICGLVAAEAVGVPGLPSPATGTLMAGAGVALLLVVLGNPVAAVLLYLVGLFLQLALPVPTTAMLGLVLVATAFAVQQRRVRPVQLGPVEFVMALFLLWNVGSALAPHPLPAGPADGVGDFSVWRFLLAGTLMPFLLYVIARTLFDREAAVRRLLWTLAGLGAYSALVSIMQYHGPRQLVWPRFIVEDPDWNDRAVGVFRQPVMNGFMLIVGFLVALRLASGHGTSRAGRVVASLIAAGSAFGVYLTYTRAVWLAFVIVLVLGALFSRGARTGFVVVLTAGALYTAVNWAGFTSNDRESGGVASSREIEDRLNGAATSLWAVEEKPLTGWGIGTFFRVNTDHHQQWSQDTRWAQGFGISSHHNELGIAAELGLVGLALWLAVLVAVFVQLRRSVRGLPESGEIGRDLAVLAMLVFVAWVIVGQTADLRFLDMSGAITMLLAGVAVGGRDRAVEPATPEVVRT